MEDFFQSCEERNYARDRRVTARYVPPPEDGLPFHWEVCDLCEGRGKVVNPSIDASGLTREDFDEDPDFAENYRSGVYDIQCPRCRGRTTVPVLDGPPRCSHCRQPYDRNADADEAFCRVCGEADCTLCPHCCGALCEGERPCTNPGGHEFECTGTAYGGDDDRWMGEGRCLCIHCGADGDG